MNDRGMISLMDAVIFISLIGLVTGVIFATVSFDDDNDVIEAYDVLDDIMSMEFRSSDILDTEDTVTYPSEIMIPVMIVNDSEKLKDVVKGYLDSVIPDHLGYRMTIDYDGTSVDMERMNGRSETSRCIGNYEIINGKILSVEVIIY